MRCLFVGFQLTVSASVTLAEANPYQGVYKGNKAVELADLEYKPELFPSTLTVLPDGRSIIIASQLPNDVLTRVIRGSFTGSGQKPDEVVSEQADGFGVDLTDPRLS
jgi:hypothetical protein